MYSCTSSTVEIWVLIAKTARTTLRVPISIACGPPNRTPSPISSSWSHIMKPFAARQSRMCTLHRPRALQNSDRVRQTSVKLRSIALSQTGLRNAGTLLFQGAGFESGRVFGNSIFHSALFPRTWDFGSSRNKCLPLYIHQCP